MCTHGSMKKTNVSSEVLILPKNSQKISKNTHTWKHEKDECFERGLDFTEKNEKCAPRAHTFWAPKRTPKWVQEQPKTGSLFGPIFGLILGSLLADFRCHLGPKTGPGEVWRSLREPSGAPRGQKDNFQKSGFRIRLSAFFRS